MSCIIEKESVAEAINFVSNNMGIVLLNLLIIYLLFYLVMCAINRTWICTIIASILYLVLPIVSKIKFNIRGEPLLLNELALARTTGDLFEFVEVSNVMQVTMLLSVLFIILFAVIIFHKKIKTKRKNSCIMLAVFIASICITFFVPNLNEMVLRQFGVELGVRYSPNIIHEKYATYIGLYANQFLNSAEKPSGYSKEKIYEILEDSSEVKLVYNTSGDDISYLILPEEETIKPNIIMIMSESFFDPYSIENVSYSKDPMPNIRKLISTNTSGTFVSSTFGGGTSYIEFEAFTGNTMEYLPYGIVPYIDLEDSLEKCETIQKELKKLDYKTIAIHPYDKSFYNRDVAYKKIGFDEFYDANTMDNIYYFGKYVSDNCLVDNIISKLEEDTMPKFIWALSMQNHTPYATSNFGETEFEIDVTSDKLFESSRDKLKAYVNGLYETDKSVKRLIEYVENTKIPTIVLFFGDHLPGFYDVYLDSGMINTKDSTKWSTKEMIKMHTLPFFIYDNYKDDITSQTEIIGAFALGNYLLRYAGLPQSSYFKFIESLNYSALRDRLFVDENGKVTDKITDDYLEQSNQHKMLEYDIIYGENYVADYNNKD